MVSGVAETSFQIIVLSGLTVQYYITNTYFVDKKRSYKLMLTQTKQTICICLICVFKSICF